MTAAETLRAARALIATPDTWTQRTFRAGDRYCAVGAIAAATGQVEVIDPYCGGLAMEAMRYLDRAVGRGQTIEMVNDSGTHADVLAAFDKAIASAEAAT